MISVHSIPMRPERIANANEPVLKRTNTKRRVLYGGRHETKRESVPSINTARVLGKMFTPGLGAKRARQQGNASA